MGLGLGFGIRVRVKVGLGLGLGLGLRFGIRVRVKVGLGLGLASLYGKIHAGYATLFGKTYAEITCRSTLPLKNSCKMCCYMGGKIIPPIVACKGKKKQKKNITFDPRLSLVKEKKNIHQF